MTDFRALCAELVEAWDDLPWEWESDFKSTVAGIHSDLYDDIAVARARAALAEPISPSAEAVLERAMEFSGPAFERLVRQMLGEAIRSVVAHTQQHRGNDVWTCDADEILAIVAKLEALPND